MSLLVAIRDKLPELTLKERELATFLLEHASEAAGLTITELAGRTGSSTATVSRFCRSFHCSSYSEFKMKLAADLARPESPNQYQDIVAGNPLPDIIRALTANHVRSLTDTTRLLDLSELRKAIDSMHRARRIDLYGSATSGLVAQDLFHKLIRIGHSAAVFTDPHMQLTSAVSLQQGDVAVGISYSGSTPETVHSLRSAAEQGATTIAITKYGMNPLASAADIRLFSTSAEAGMRRGDMASRMAQLHVIDILFTGLVSEHFNEYVPRLERSFQTVRRRYTGKEERNPK